MRLRIIQNFVRDMEDVITVLNKNGGYITSAMAQREGRGLYYKLLSLYRDGEIVKIKGACMRFQMLWQTYWEGRYLNLGVETSGINGYDIKIYDIEKSVCDAIRFRNKIGIDVCGEILLNYLKRKYANIPKLMEYGCKLRISQTLNKYLEIQVWQ